MPASDLSRVALEAMRLQNGYALAIDARDWELFRTVFTPDVQADYPHSTFDGVEAWLDSFIPFHDTCAWTLHEITNHVVGEDSQGIWGTCYGWVRWTMKDKPGYLNRAEVLFRDRLREDGGTWRISRRMLRMLSAWPQAPLPDGYNLVQSVQDLADRQFWRLGASWKGVDGPLLPFWRQLLPRRHHAADDLAAQLVRDQLGRLGGTDRLTDLAASNRA